MSAPSVCPVRGICTAPGPCAQVAGCVLQTPARKPPAPQRWPFPLRDEKPLILTPLSDWRADPTPYLLRADTKPRAQFPQGVSCR